MKRSIAICFVCLFHLTIFAQQKEFEGIVTYRQETRSKSELISDNVMKTLLGVGNMVTIYVKHGNYKQITPVVTSYYVPKDQRVYNKFNNIDTLYYVEYSSDSATIKKISKPDEKKTIAGFECKAITIETSDAVRKYYYAPALYQNPDYDINNTISKFNTYIKETSSLYLESTEETKMYSISGSCTRIQQTEISDSIFELPKLPIKKFVPDELITPPEFTKPGGWDSYLSKNVNMDIVSKYLKLPKGEESISQKVMVKFLVNEYGKIIYAEVENKKEVHPKLAEEALRVVNASPLWKPAVIYNSSKTIFWLKKPIIFMITKDAQKN